MATRMRLRRVFEYARSSPWTVRIVVVAATIVFPALHASRATSASLPFVRYLISGTVRDTAGKPASGVLVSIVGKGRYSLDSAYAVVQLGQGFNDDISDMTTGTDGAFAVWSSLVNSYPDSVSAMAWSPRAFGRFILSGDSLAAQTQVVERIRQASGGCSCTPTESIVTYQGTQYAWTNYAIVVKP